MKFVRLEDRCVNLEQLSLIELEYASIAKVWQVWGYVIGQEKRIILAFYRELEDAQKLLDKLMEE